MDKKNLRSKKFKLFAMKISKKITGLNNLNRILCVE